jgi:hypothetical protein
MHVQETYFALMEHMRCKTGKCRHALSSFHHLASSLTSTAHPVNTWLGSVPLELRSPAFGFAMFLPAELISAVVGHIADSEPDLRAGALVHRDWTPICQRRLFSYVIARDERWNRLQNLLRLVPRLRSFVHELEIWSSESSPTPDEMATLFPCLSALHINKLDYQLFNCLPSLTKLVLSESSQINLATTEERCHVRLESVSYDHRSQSTAQGLLLEWLSRGDLRRMRSAGLEHVWTQHEALAHFLQQAIYLEHLDLFMKMISNNGWYERALFTSFHV